MPIQFLMILIVVFVLLITGATVLVRVMLNKTDYIIEEVTFNNGNITLLSRHEVF